MNIVFPDRIDLDEPSKAALKRLGVQMYDDTPNDAATIITRIRDAEIITANFIDITKEVIDGAPRLKYIISSAVGYEWIDAAYAASKGIAVLNCPTQNSEAVAEHAVALMLAVTHRVAEADLDLQHGGWNQQNLVGTEISHKKLGLVGYGRVGKLIEQKVSGLQMAVRHTDSKSSSKELDNLLQDSDVVCLCLPLNEATRNIIDARRVQLLKKSAIFINVARGGLVDQGALVTALKEKKIFGAGLDVFHDEPFTGNAPQSIVEIASLPNMVATPHMAYNTHETMQRLGRELIENITSCIAGKPTNVVN